MVAWAFLGPDGSLTSLHVEPGHRGRGLAKAVAGRLLTALAHDEAGMGFRPVVGNGAGNGTFDRDDNGGESATNTHANASEDGSAGPGGWAHSDVAAGNVESAAVAKGLGGTEGWSVRWVGVDLRAVAGC